MSLKINIEKSAGVYAVAYNDAAIVVFGDGCFLNHIVGICVPNRRTARGRIAVNG